MTDENLTQKRIRERDQLSAFERARGQMSGFSQMSESDPKAKKQAFDEAYKLTEQKRKTETSEARTSIAVERLSAMEKNHQDTQALAEKAAELRVKEFEIKQKAFTAELDKKAADLALQQHKLDSTIQVTKQTTGMFSEMEKLRDEKGLLTPTAIANLRAQFPDAAIHANNASALEHEVRRYDEAAKLQAAVPKEPTPDQAGFISRYKGAVQGVKGVDPILKKGGLSIDSKWDSADSDFQKAVNTGKITHDEARTAANAIDAFRGTVQTGSPLATLQPHYDEISGKLSALTPQASPAAAPAQGNVAQPQAAPVADRTTLAKQALDDPNASEDHKIAARKILGL